MLIRLAVLIAFTANSPCFVDFLNRESDHAGLATATGRSHVKNPSPVTERNATMTSVHLHLEELQQRAVPSVLVHLQDYGDRTFRDGAWAGTKGESRRLEGFQVSPNHTPNGVRLEYMAHLQGIGDTAWVSEGEFVGTRGQSRRVEGIAFRLRGREASTYVAVYQRHLEGVGDTRE